MKYLTAEEQLIDDLLRIALKRYTPSRCEHGKPMQQECNDCLMLWELAQRPKDAVIQ